jgi:hypothetical protein
MKKIEFTQEELKIMRTIMCFIKMESSYNFNVNSRIEKELKIAECKVFLYEKEIDFNLFEKIHAKFF